MDLQEVFENSDDLIAFPAGAEILTEENAGDCLYVVVEGEVIVSLQGMVLAKAQPGEVVGEMALINSKIRSASARAGTDCLLAKIDQKSFESLLRHVPEFNRHLISVLAGRLEHVYELIRKNRTAN